MNKGPGVDYYPGPFTRLNGFGESLRQTSLLDNARLLCEITAVLIHHGWHDINRVDRMPTIQGTAKERVFVQY
jgi:hypothetical protein